jgi:hypothetical protein
MKLPYDVDAQAITTVQSGTALACDFAITVALCFTLHTGRRDIQGCEFTFKEPFTTFVMIYLLMLAESGH